MGKLVPQYGQLADCGPVHFTSCPRMGPLQLGHTEGNNSMRCSCGGGGAMTGAGWDWSIAAGFGASVGVCSLKACGAYCRRNPS